MHHEIIGFPWNPGSSSGDPGGVIFYHENLNSGQKRKLTDRKEQNIFFLMREVNSLSHYYRENFIYKSQAVNFLFLTTVYTHFEAISIQKIANAPHRNLLLGPPIVV